MTSLVLRHFFVALCPVWQPLCLLPSPDPPCAGPLSGNEPRWQEACGFRNAPRARRTVTETVLLLLDSRAPQSLRRVLHSSGTRGPHTRGVIDVLHGVAATRGRYDTGSRIGVGCRSPVGPEGIRFRQERSALWRTGRRCAPPGQISMLVQLPAPGLSRQVLVASAPADVGAKRKGATRTTLPPVRS